MKKQYAYAIIILSLLMGVCLVICNHGNAIFEAKFNDLTSTLFSGFLTISTFIFAFETFIIFEMKKGVYDSSKYIEEFKQETQNDRYAQLKDFSNFLLLSTAVSFFTAIMYIIHDVIRAYLTLSIAIIMSFVSVAYLILSWILLRKNLRSYFLYNNSEK